MIRGQWVGAAVAGTAWVLLVAAGCSSPQGKTLSAEDLRGYFIEMEQSTTGRPREKVRQQLRRIAAQLMHRRVEVNSAVVAALYERDNPSRIYYGATYDPDDHLYLAELDPELDAFFRNHRYWASVVTTLDDRQLSFEVALDEATHSRLEQGRAVSFSCELATIIRRYSVYCREIEMRELDH